MYLSVISEHHLYAFENSDFVVSQTYAFLGQDF